MAADQDFVRVTFDEHRRKLRFKHRDLRDAVKQSGQSIGDLFQDPFGGWPYLLLMGLRFGDHKMTLDKASEFIDLWVNGDEDRNIPKRELGDLGMILLDALNASGFITLSNEAPELVEGAEQAEGNAQTEDALTPSGI